MSKKRKQYSSQFKAKVAIEAIQWMRTVAELSRQYNLHLTTIQSVAGNVNCWKGRVNYLNQVSAEAKQKPPIDKPRSMNCTPNRSRMPQLLLKPKIGHSSYQCCPECLRHG